MASKLQFTYHAWVMVTVLVVVILPILNLPLLTTKAYSLTQITPIVTGVQAVAHLPKAETESQSTRFTYTSAPP